MKLVLVRGSLVGPIDKVPGMGRTDYWKIHASFIRFLSKSGRDKDRISGKLIQIWRNFQEIGLAHDQILYKKWICTHEVRRDEFSENRSDS